MNSGKISIIRWISTVLLHPRYFLCALFILSAGFANRSPGQVIPASPPVTSGDPKASRPTGIPKPGTTTSRNRLPHYGAAADAPRNPQAAQVHGHATQRIHENLDRGLTAVALDANKVYLSWRLLEEDPTSVSFNVHRIQDNKDIGRINSRPVVQTTDFVDENVPKNVKQLAYYVVPDGQKADPKTAKATAVDLTKPWRGYFSIPLNGHYSTNAIAFGDLDGDGRLEMVIRWPPIETGPGGPWVRSVDTNKIEAYTQDGKMLWQHDMGWSIELGTHYAPFVVYDLDGDGKAEVITKYNPGDHREKEQRPGSMRLGQVGGGRVESGPEYLAILDGMTGKIKATIEWPSREEWTPDLVIPQDIFKSGYTGSTYNQYESRNQIGVAYLDGKTPCVIVSRGVYHLIVTEALEYTPDGQLRELWRWSNRNLPRKYWGQASHNMVTVDLDGDGRDEVLLGSMALDDDGSVLWTTGLGHADASHVGDLDPTRPGREIYYNIENKPYNLQQLNTMCMVDAATGELIWGYDYPTQHVHHSGLCADIDANHPGAECYGGERASRTVRWLWNSKGKLLSTEDLNNHTVNAVYWDDTPQKAIITGTRTGYIDRPEPQNKYSDYRVRKYNGPVISSEIEGRVLAVADIFGDWREEIITATEGELRIYFTTIPAAYRTTCLLQDHFYRNNVASFSGGYIYNPILSYDMATKYKVR